MELFRINLINGYFCLTITFSMKASELAKGNTYTIKSIEELDFFLNLLELGINPGKEIELIHSAPFKGPMAFSVSGNIIALRKEEAAAITVEQKADLA
jgi:ferrous iron transport protein A